MYRKLNLKTLSVVFGVLFALVVISKITDISKGENTLKEKLVSVSPDEITSVKLYPKMLKGEAVTLIKTNQDWNVKFKDKSYNGDSTAINSMIKQLVELKPLRLASRSNDNWGKYEVTDSLASRVVLMNHDNELATIYIGKFSYLQPKQNNMQQQQYQYYQQPRGTMTTYVRTGNEKEVYAVEGFLSSQINRDANAFRNKQLLHINKDLLNKITFEYPADSSFTMVKNENKWMIEGQPVDSASVEKYLGAISNLQSSSFTDEKPGSFTHTVKLQDSQMNMAEVKANIKEDEVVIHSSLNPDAVFKERKAQNFDKIFISKNKLTSK